MSRICQVTGKKAMVGNNVSHSKRRTKRKFYPNLFVKKYYLPEEERWISLKISASGIRLISKKGTHKRPERSKRKRLHFELLKRIENGKEG